MPYTVRSSEKLRKTATDFETKAMLYLMNFREDSSQIHYFVVDFFNDVTGMDRMAEKLWDVQSKATKSASAKEIGKELVTLFKNFVSEFDFSEYVLFLGAVPDTFRIDNSLSVFQINNINDKALKSIRIGLIEECQKKEYIDNSAISDANIDGLLSSVWFVVDDKEAKEYIREIIKKHPRIIPSDSELIAIFNEIRNKQSEKKNSLVEGIVIDQIDEVLNDGRHLSTNEIRLLVLQRIINTDPLSKGIPGPFSEIYSKFPPETAKDMVEDCKRSLCCALFNKSAAQGFWKMFDTVYGLIQKYPDKTLDFLFSHIDQETKEGCPDFDVLSLKYFIAKVKEGILK